MDPWRTFCARPEAAEAQLRAALAALDRPWVSVAARRRVAPGVGARLARLYLAGGRLDDHGAAFQRLAVHAVDGGLRFGVRAHLDEAEALGAAGVAVHHDLGGRDGTELRKGLVQRIVTHRIGKIADVKFVSHGGALYLEQRTMWSFNPARTIQAKALHPTHAYSLSGYPARGRKGMARFLLFCRLQANP